MMPRFFIFIFTILGSMFYQHIQAQRLEVVNEFINYTPNARHAWSIEAENPELFMWLANLNQNGTLTFYKDFDLKDKWTQWDVSKILFPSILDPVFRDTWKEIEDKSKFQKFEDDWGEDDDEKEVEDNTPMPKALKEKLDAGTSMAGILDLVDRNHFDTYFKSLNYQYTMGFVEEWDLSGEMLLTKRKMCYIRAGDIGEILPTKTLLFSLDEVDFPFEILKLLPHRGAVEEDGIDELLFDRRLNELIRMYKSPEADSWEGDSTWMSSGYPPHNADISMYLDSVWKLPSKTWKHYPGNAISAQQTIPHYRIAVPRSLDHPSQLHYSIPSIWPEDSSVFKKNEAFFQDLVEPLVEAVLREQIAFVLPDSIENGQPYKGLEKGEIQKILEVNAIPSIQKLTAEQEIPKDIRGPLEGLVEVSGKLIKTKNGSEFQPEYLIITWLDPEKNFPAKHVFAVPLSELDFLIQGKSATDFLAARDYHFQLVSLNGDYIYKTPDAVWTESILRNGNWEQIPGPAGVRKMASFSEQKWNDLIRKVLSTD